MEIHRLKRLCGMFVLIIILCLQLVPVAAATAETPDTAEFKVVRVACGMNDALYLNDAGEAEGICLPYLQQLAWNNNWTVEYVEGSYNESIQNLYDGKVDVMFPVGTDEDSEGRLLFSEFIGGYQQIGLFAKADADIFYDDYESFDQKKVGLSLGGNSVILDEYAKEHGFTYEAVSLNSTQDKVDALMAGEVDLIAFSTLNTVAGGKLVAVLDQLPFYFCTSVDKPEILAEINSGMSKSMVNTPDVVSAMYEDVLKGYNTVSFTKAENEKIKSIDKVTFGVYGDRLPLAGIDEKGNCVGIYVDILKAIATESGLNIEIKAIEDSNQLYSNMDDGTVDFVIGIKELRYSSENADNYLMSNSITEYTTVAVTMPDYQFEGDEEQVIALTRDRTYLENYIYANYPNAEIRYCDTRKECLEIVRKGNADATFLNTWEYNYESKNARFRELYEWESVRIISNVALGATLQSDLGIMSIFEKAISQLPTDKMSDIIAANLNMSYQTYNLEDRIYEMKDELLITAIVLLVLFGSMAIYWSVKRKYIKDLVIANKVKTDFLSRMSHELRTPLNAINGYATLTMQDVVAIEGEKSIVTENMTAIQKASEYLLGIINDILDVQRMETGKVTIDKTEINLTEYMDTIVRMIQPMADEKRIRFTYRMRKGAADNYLLDGLRLQQVLFNVLYNAIKFTPESGKVTLTSDVTARDGDKATLQFTIADTGIGMSQEFLAKKLFLKFEQENQDITSPYAGCGNGLAICKELIHLMDGEISCESVQGEGSTFTITLTTEYRRQEKKKREQTSVPAVDLTGVRVLMCEDNPMNQNMTKRLLEKLHCEVEVADNGRIGLDLFTSHETGYYNLILMDIRMPEMDGLETSRELRALEREDAESIPIIAVSANAFDEDIRLSLEAGMNEHLAKPVDARLLAEKIQKYCRS